MQITTVAVAVELEMTISHLYVLKTFEMVPPLSSRIMVGRDVTLENGVIQKVLLG